MSKPGSVRVSAEALRQDISEKAFGTVRDRYVADAALPPLKAAYQRLIRESRRAT